MGASIGTFMWKVWVDTHFNLIALEDSYEQTIGSHLLSRISASSVLSTPHSSPRKLVIRISSMIRS